MGRRSGISWTQATFNPWKGCRKVSGACKNCYAERLAKRVGEDFAGMRIVTSPDYWSAPHKWNLLAEKGLCISCSGKGFIKDLECDACDGSGRFVGRPKVFCASLADVFEDWDGPMVRGKLKTELSICHGCNRLVTMMDDCECGRLLAERVPRPARMDDLRRRLFSLIDATPNLDWLLLTKRPENIIRMWPSVGFPDSGVPGTLGRRLYLGNVWLGTTVEDQVQADNRIPELLKCRGLAHVLFLSCEPLLGPIDLRPALWLEDQYFSFRGGECLGSRRGVDWVISGGESGPGSRPSPVSWHEDLKSHCGAAGVAFHFKQLSECDFPKVYSNYDYFPESLKVREFPW